MSFENFSLILPKNNNDINGIFHKYNNINAIPFASYEYPEKIYGNYAPIKPDSTYNWLSNNKNNSWYRLRFPNILFYITNYSIQAGDKGCNSNYCCYRFPSKWRLDGKANGIWRKLDFVENSGFTNKSDGEVLTRKVYTEHYVSEVKLTFLGPHVNFVNCGQEENVITIYKLDFFGFFSKSSFHPITKSCRKFSLMPFMFIYLYIIY